MICFAPNHPLISKKNTAKVETDVNKCAHMKVQAGLYFFGYGDVIKD